MMTTATTRSAQRARPGTRVVAFTAVPVVVGTALLAVVGGLVSGSSGAYGALVGGLLLLVVLASSTLVVDLVSTVAPAPALLVALVTFTLHVLLVVVALLAIERSGLTESTLHAQWLGGAVILGALVWSVAQVWLHTRLRVPLYDLPERPVVPSERGRA